MGLAVRVQHYICTLQGGSQHTLSECKACRLWEYQGLAMSWRVPGNVLGKALQSRIFCMHLFQVRNNCCIDNGPTTGPKTIVHTPFSPSTSGVWGFMITWIQLGRVSGNQFQLYGALRALYANVDGSIWEWRSKLRVFLTWSQVQGLRLCFCDDGWWEGFFGSHSDKSMVLLVIPLMLSVT